jgi:antitoxin (DNA-binding transcriptional repressor) of toxin-antitoxin stability system
MEKQSAPKYVSKGVLKSHMLEYFREIERTGKELIVTDHRKPVLKIIPLERKAQSTESIFKPYRKRIVYREDITTPTTDEWSEV